MPGTPTNVFDRQELQTLSGVTYLCKPSNRRLSSRSIVIEDDDVSLNESSANFNARTTLYNYRSDCLILIGLSVRSSCYRWQ